MRLFDTSHPFYRPLWVRLAIVAVCVAWVALESTGAWGFWLAASMITLAYSVWAFIISYPKDAP